MQNQFSSNDLFTRISDQSILQSLIKEASLNNFQNSECKEKQSPSPCFEQPGVVIEKGIGESAKADFFEEPRFLQSGDICEVIKDWDIFSELLIKSQYVVVNVRELVQFLGRIIHVIQIESDGLVYLRSRSKPPTVAFLPVEVLIDENGETPKLQPILEKPEPITPKQRCISLEEETFMLKDQIIHLQRQKDLLNTCVVDLKASEESLLKHMQDLREEKENLSIENQTLIQHAERLYEDMKIMVKKDYTGLEEIISSGIDSQTEVQNAMKLLMERQTALTELREQELLAANLRLESNMEHYTVCRICLDAPKDQLLRPCNHVCCCSECVKMVTKCPVCRTAIHSVETLYL